MLVSFPSLQSIIRDLSGTRIGAYRGGPRFGLHGVAENQPRVGPSKPASSMFLWGCPCLRIRAPAGALERGTREPIPPRVPPRSDAARASRRHACVCDIAHNRGV